MKKDPDAQSDTASDEQPRQPEQPAEQSVWQENQPEDTPPPKLHTVEWTSAEYISHDKTSAWYALFALAVCGIAVLLYLITRETIAPIIVVVTGGSAGFFASRPPGSKKYKISEKGLQINEKSYGFDSFKSFSVVEEGTHDSIWLKPTKRFAPFLIIYFSPKEEAKIIESLSAVLPHEQRELDSLDKLTRTLRF